LPGFELPGFELPDFELPDFELPDFDWPRPHLHCSLSRPVSRIGLVA
jgi:hypothetical protein